MGTMRNRRWTYAAVQPADALFLQDHAENRERVPDRRAGREPPRHRLRRERRGLAAQRRDGGAGDDLRGRRLVSSARGRLGLFGRPSFGPFAALLEQVEYAVRQRRLRRDPDQRRLQAAVQAAGALRLGYGGAGGEEAAHAARLRRRRDHPRGFELPARGRGTSRQRAAADGEARGQVVQREKQSRGRQAGQRAGGHALRRACRAPAGTPFLPSRRPRPRRPRPRARPRAACLL